MQSATVRLGLFCRTGGVPTNTRRDEDDDFDDLDVEEEEDDDDDVEKRTVVFAVVAFPDLPLPLTTAIENPVTPSIRTEEQQRRKNEKEIMAILVVVANNEETIAAGAGVVVVAVRVVRRMLRCDIMMMISAGFARLFVFQ